LTKLIINKDKCKGCRLCILTCPKKALLDADHRNSKSYIPIQVDDDKCNKCGLCYIVCPDYVFEILEG
jgi:2-oxoglutarate ferredoxin oxidoreductase subunit delta